MAIKDSRSLVKQWSLYDPSKFLWHIPFKPLGQEWVETHYDVNVPENSLLDEVYSLSKREITERYPAYHHKKHTGSFHKLTRAGQIEISPDYIKDMHDAEEATSEIWDRMNLGVPSRRKNF